MATREGFENIVESRIRCVDALIGVGEWHVASYMMGHLLECALKATICRVLKVSDYPGDMNHTDRKLPDFFRTHFFDRLVLLAALSETFSTHGNASEFDNWSQFTSKLAGDWVAIRYYDPDKQFDESTARGLYQNLISDEYSIMKVIKKTWI